MMLYFIVWFVTSHENISYYITSYTTNNTLHYTTLHHLTLHLIISDGWQHETQILTWVLSYDKVHSPDALSICSASAAMCISEVRTCAHMHVHVLTHIHMHIHIYLYLHMYLRRWCLICFGMCVFVILWSLEWQTCKYEHERERKRTSLCVLINFNLHFIKSAH